MKVIYIVILTIIAFIGGLIIKPVNRYDYIPVEPQVVYERCEKQVSCKQFEGALLDMSREYGETFMILDEMFEIYNSSAAAGIRIQAIQQGESRMDIQKRDYDEIGL